jgi:hypothetical protein
MSISSSIPTHLLPGQKLRHYKGGIYTVIGNCMIEATLQPGILYRAHQGDESVTWFRPLEEFDQDVVTENGTTKRFAPV